MLGVVLSARGEINRHEAYAMPCHAVPCEAAGGLREAGVTGRVGTCWRAWLRCGSVRVVVVGSGGYSVGRGQGRGRAELHRRLEIGIARQRRIVSGTAEQSRETSTSTATTMPRDKEPGRPASRNIIAAAAHARCSSTWRLLGATATASTACQLVAALAEWRSAFVSVQPCQTRLTDCLTNKITTNP
jgi:hypothetical protein